MRLSCLRRRGSALSPRPLSASRHLPAIAPSTRSILNASYSRSFTATALPFTSVVIYRHPPALEREDVQTKVALELHGEILEHETPQLLAKFCTPKEDGNFTIREMRFCGSTPIEDVFERALPHFPGVEQLTLYNEGDPVPEEEDFEYVVRDGMKKLSIQADMEDGSSHSIAVNGGLKISIGPGFQATLDFFRACATGLAFVLLAWHLFKPEKQIHPELEMYKKGAVITPEMEELEKQQEQLREDEKIIKRGLLWKEMEDGGGGEIVRNLPWAPKQEDHSPKVY